MNKGRFSERHGYKAVREALQFESMDGSLRNRLWSLLQKHYWTGIQKPTTYIAQDHVSLNSRGNAELSMLCNRLWDKFFKFPIDNLPSDWKKVKERIRSYFFKAKWNQIYDFIEFVSLNFPDRTGSVNQEFRESCNQVLEEEMSAYRFVAELIAPISNEVEIGAIEEALGSSDELILVHLRAALRMLSDKEQRHYRNSIKESISAVERLASVITGDENGTLGGLLKKMRSKKELHPALEGAFKKLYGYTSDSKTGIRHALSESDKTGFEEAKFMLVVCSAFINFVNETMMKSL